jgi:hypothetical protein
MIFFDLDKLKRLNNNRQMLLAFKSITYPTPLPSKYQARINKFLYQDFSGSSFMLNPEKLCEEYRATSPTEVVEYIILAGRRSYAEYLLTGDSSLDKLIAPFIPTNNRLLTITDKIYFKHE